MKISLSKEETKEWDRISKALDETIEESSFWNAALSGEVPFEEWRRYAYKLDPKSYEKDVFYKNVRPSPFRSGDASLFYKEYRPFEGFVYNEIEIAEDTYRETTPFGYFENRFPFLAIEKGETTWMSVIPHEMNTMREPLSQAKGKALVLGLGLGYFAYHALLKKEVSEVIVIEKDPEVIALFRKEILPFFPKEKKFEIKKEDAFAYLENGADFDFCFADLWHMPEDGLPLYLKLRKLEKIRPDALYAYWIEKSMLALIRRALIVLFDETIHRLKKPLDYEKAATWSDRLINSLYRLLEGIDINNIADLRRYLDFEGLRKIALLLSFEA